MGNETEEADEERNHEMSITTGNVPMQGWKRVKMQYVAAACGIAMAVSAAIGLSGAFEGDTKAGGSSAVVPPAPSVAPAAGLPQMVFYVVGSEFERARLEASFAAEMNMMIESGGDLKFSFSILVADTPESERRAMQIINNANAEATEFGTFTVDYVDLRPGLEPID
jgi:hypothetical protein